MSKIVKMSHNEHSVREQLSSLVGSSIDVDMKGYEPVNR